MSVCSSGNTFHSKPILQDAENLIVRHMQIGEVRHMQMGEVPETQKVQTFRSAEFHEQKLSERSV